MKRVPGSHRGRRGGREGGWEGGMPLAVDFPQVQLVVNISKRQVVEEDKIQHDTIVAIPL